MKTVKCTRRALAPKASPRYRQQRYTMRFASTLLASHRSEPGSTPSAEHRPALSQYPIARQTLACPQWSLLQSRYHVCLNYHHDQVCDANAISQCLMHDSDANTDRSQIPLLPNAKASALLASNKSNRSRRSSVAERRRRSESESEQ
jgi:hypothetical protein